MLLSLSNRAGRRVVSSAFFFLRTPSTREQHSGQAQLEGIKSNSLPLPNAAASSLLLNLLNATHCQMLSEKLSTFLGRKMRVKCTGVEGDTGVSFSQVKALVENKRVLLLSTCS